MASRRSLDSGRAEYEARLQELFEESDITDKGYLDVEEVNALCSRLQLGRLKEKLVKGLQDRGVDKNKVFFDEFRTVFFTLLEELEAQQNRSPRKTHSKGQDDPQKSPKAAPKLVIGRKKYGRRSLPFNKDVEMKSLGGPTEGSYSQFLQELDANDRSSPFVELEGKHVKRRRHSHLASSPTKAKEETYEAEGQFPMAEEPPIEKETGMRQLRDVCQQLGVGGSGYLNQTEFGAVCSYIGMGKVDGEELAAHFNGMDTNKDGLISLSELINGLPPSSTFPSSPNLRRSSARSKATTPRSRSHSRSRKDERALSGSTRGTNPSQLVSGDFFGLFSSIESSYDGYAKAEDIIDFLDGLGVSSGGEVLTTMGFSATGKVKLTELSSSLDQELTNPVATEAVHHAALVCYQQEVRHLKSVVDQAQEESKKLKLDLSEANARNTLLAREVDERHAQLDKSWETKLMTVEQKYQEQVKNLQSELDWEREAGASQASRLRGQLEEIQNQATFEEQQFTDRLTGSQKEISRLEKEVQDMTDKLKASKKQNEQLKGDLQLKLQMVEKSPVVEVDKEELMEQKQRLEWKQEENKKLKDENDELLAQLEEARQKLQAAQRLGQTNAGNQKSESAPSTPSRIPVMRSSAMSPCQRLSVSSVEVSETDDDETSGVASARAAKSQKRGKRPKLTGSTQSLDSDCQDVPSLSKELFQQQREEMLERERREMEHRYRLEINALEERHNMEREKILHNFQQEKEWILEEQKVNEEALLSEQLKELQTAFAQEKQDIIQKYESEKNFIHHQFEEEKKALQKRLSIAESQMESSAKTEQLIQNLEAQLARCQDDLHDLEVEKADLSVRLRQREEMLSQQFEEERRNLAERFTRELEQRQINHRHQMEQLLSGGAEGLTGKLRDDFLALVRKHTEEEVGHSQAAILNQLQKDRNGIAAALEQEKSQIYEEAESQKQALMEKYNSEISALKLELSQVRAQLEHEKQAVTEAVQRGATTEKTMVGQEVVQNLRKEMEDELIVELAKMKESFDSEKKELETQKSLLEDELSELQGHLEEEKKKTAEMEALKETMKVLKSEKKEVEGMVEGMKEKLFLAYQQKGAEQAALEAQFQEKRLEGRNEGLVEGQSQGKQEGLLQGREEGFRQGKNEGYDEGFNKGREEGFAKGKEKGRAEVQDLDKKQMASKEEQKAKIEDLRHEKNVLENLLQQERDKSAKLMNHSQDRDRLKASFDQILGEKHALETKYQESCDMLLEQHQAEKDHLLEEIRRLEQHRLQVQTDKRAIEAHMGAVHQELELAQQAINEDVSQTDDDPIIEITKGQGALQEQMTLLQYQLQEAQTAQRELGHLKEEYDHLLQDKGELEEMVRKLRQKSSDDESIKIKSQLAQIKTLSEEKQKIQALLDQTSNQLVKASTSMALAQSKFVRELETLKQQAKSMVEMESYTQLQISLVEHQRLVITLQDAIREREALVDKVIKEGDEEVQRVTQVMEAKVKEAQKKLEASQEEFLKQKEKHKQLCTLSNRRVVMLKDLYVENADLMKSLTDSEDKRRRTERMVRKLLGKCENYKRTIDRLCHTLSR